MLDDIMHYLYIIPCAIIAVVLHEYSHGLVSYWLGDPTPKEMGRLTVNPSKHLDLIGVVCLIFLGFGWAKPVMVNPTYYKKPKIGMTLVALAGPLINFILMILSFVFMGLCLKIMIWQNGFDNVLLDILFNFFYYLGWINLGLCLFNLIPLPPLDGSKIIGVVLPEKAYVEYMGYQKYGTYFIIGLLLLFEIMAAYGLNSPLEIAMNEIFNFFYELMLNIIV